jgi:hypothetical protein
MAEHLPEEQIESVARGGPRPAHLSVCIECARRVSRAGGRVKLLAEFRKYTLSDEALKRVEHRVLEELAKPAASWWPSWGWALAGVAAVVLVGLYWKGAPEKAPVSPVAKKEPAVPVQRALTLEAYRVEGNVKARAKGEESWNRFVAQARLDDGAALSLNNGAAWLKSVPEGLTLKTTASLSLGSKAQLVMDGDGEWLLDVKPVKEPRIFFVGQHWLSTTEAVFRVVKTAAQVVIDVRRGAVLVSGDPFFRNPQRLQGPQVWTHPAGGSAAGTVWNEPRVPIGGELARLDVGGLPEGTLVQVGDAGFVPGPLSALLPLGAYDVGVRLPGQSRVQHSRIELKPGGTSFVPPKLSAEPLLPENAAAIALIPQVVASRRPSLKPCVDKWLKNDPGANASIEVELAISPQGKVKRVAVVQGEVPPAIRQCLVTTMRNWPFPKLGGADDTVVTLPLVLGRGAGGSR